MKALATAVMCLACLGCEVSPGEADAIGMSVVVALFAATCWLLVKLVKWAAGVPYRLMDHWAKTKAHAESKGPDKS